MQSCAQVNVKAINLDYAIRNILKTKKDDKM